MSRWTTGAVILRALGAETPRTVVSRQPPCSRRITDEGASNGANGAVAPTDDQIALLEAEIADWQRRAVIWRERALSTQALNEALTKNLDDLRAVLALRTEAEAAAGGGSTPAARPADEQWWTRVFRRETWTLPR